MLRDFKENKGFSLIEILVAITLLAIMMIYIVNITNDAVKTKESVTFEDRDYLQIETALNRFELDFTQIYSPLFFEGLKKENKTFDDPDSNPETDSTIYRPTPNFPLVTSENSPVPIIENPNNYTLSFLSLSNRRKVQNAKESLFVWVRYEVRSSEKEKDDEESKLRNEGSYELVRYTIATDIYRQDLDWEKEKPQILLKYIKKLSFLFWDETKEDYVDKIRLLTNPNLLRGVKIIFTWINPSGGETEITREFRPLWPSFNTKKDEESKKTIPTDAEAQ